MDSEKHSTVMQLLAGLGLVVVLLVMAFPAHCSTSAPRHDNSLGVVIPYDNPFVYNFGNIQSGTVIRDRKSDRLATNIQFQPYGTFELYSEQLLFCGNAADDFRGMTGPIVLTYERVAHTMVGGVACHNLLNVTKVTAEKDEQ